MDGAPDPWEDVHSMATSALPGLPGLGDRTYVFDGNKAPVSSGVHSLATQGPVKEQPAYVPSTRAAAKLVQKSNGGARAGAYAGPQAPPSNGGGTNGFGSLLRARAGVGNDDKPLPPPRPDGLNAFMTEFKHAGALPPHDDEPTPPMPPSPEAGTKELNNLKQNEMESRQREKDSAELLAIFAGSKGDIPVPDTLTPTQKTELADMIEVFGELLVRCLHSKMYQLREMALSRIARQIQSAELLPQGQIMFDSTIRVTPIEKAKVLPVVISLIKKHIVDRNLHVYLAADALLGAAADRFSKKMPRKEAAQVFGPIIATLVPKLGETQVKMRSTVTKMLSNLCKLEGIGPSMVCEHLTRTTDFVSSGSGSAVAGKALAARLAYLVSVIQKYQLQPTGAIAMEAPMNLAVVCFDHKSAEVRDQGLELAAACYSQISKRVQMFLQGKKISSKMMHSLEDRFKEIDSARKQNADDNFRRLGSRQSSRRSSRQNSSRSIPSIYPSDSEGASTRRTESDMSDVENVVPNHDKADNKLPKKKEPKQLCAGLSFDVIARCTNVRQRSGEDLNAFLTRLSHLNLNGKGITTMEGLKVCKNVQVLYLYENMLDSIGDLSWARSLTHLYLQNNNITEMEGLSSVPQLRKLYLDHNRINHMSGMGNNVYLEELHLSNQVIPENTQFTFDLESLQTLAHSLLVLNLSNVGLIDCMPIGLLQRIDSLDLSKNLIHDFGNVSDMLMGTTIIRELNLTGNPVCSITGGPTTKYRSRILLTCYSLETLDGKKVDRNERIFIMSLEKRKREMKARSRTAGDVTKKQAGGSAGGGRPHSASENHMMPSDGVLEPTAMDLSVRYVEMESADLQPRGFHPKMPVKRTMSNGQATLRGGMAGAGSHMGSGISMLR